MKVAGVASLCVVCVMRERKLVRAFNMDRTVKFDLIDDLTVEINLKNFKADAGAAGCHAHI